MSLGAERDAWTPAGPIEINESAALVAKVSAVNRGNLSGGSANGGLPQKVPIGTKKALFGAISALPPWLSRKGPRWALRKDFLPDFSEKGVFWKRGLSRDSREFRDSGDSSSAKTPFAMTPFSGPDLPDFSEI